MPSKTLTMMAVGDLIFDDPEAESLPCMVESVLKSAQVAVGQLEVMFTSRGEKQNMEVPAPPCDPRNLNVLKKAYFNVVTLAGNHVWDSGDQGIKDTIRGLKRLGIEFTGAGMNHAEAKRPCIITRNNTRIGFLAYNCVGPRASWAGRDKPGCSYLRVLTFYEQNHETPGSPPAIYTFGEPESIKAMNEDIRELRKKTDILVVSLHKGFPHTPAKLLGYEHEICRSAIDSGADLILGHHAHILKGIDFYKGKVIFHGLGNFITVTSALTDGPDRDLKDWIRRRKELFGFEPDPEYPTFPFHPEARQTIIAKLTITNGKISQVGYIPCLVNKKGQPEPLINDKRGNQVFEYMKKITKEAGLKADFNWKENEVVVTEQRERG